MRLPKGFGKNYFTLRAITATTNQVTLHARASCVESFHMSNFNGDEQEVEIEDDDLAAALPLELSSKPCHCNCYYFCRTRKTLLLCKFQKLISNYFENLNNNLSPPPLTTNKTD
ncbi:hypothetical protein Suden_0119 [Sulfurimonas denitrificans DSM 1251]|uniref:Uncharacterized protein n=1 Tax=Sulfurimonas denitrificans (strain ATCC 33889 / DSM 1251) TaxID=326298 RepID=Q30UD1_SULDN|nr:hypothetical protein [Sulfurimonas denitrificans]ABB43400.1 hypothetical protein Suden_0119 [Sulfurimonas denitrificans DSM 1251]MDD3442250.1 hypothetical protein [Sulfurimonas denitrificans]